MKRKKSKYKHAVIDKKKYYFYKIVWNDPMGDSGHCDAAEMKELKQYFDDKNNHPLKSKLNIILILFPVQNKVELVKGMHNKLSLLQKLGE